uniref:BRCT domain-containing protein n=1 Tax=Romanomermis culicivorax TaxID=13658 RepID=A0A915HT78_ROMCU
MQSVEILPNTIILDYANHIMKHRPWIITKRHKRFVIRSMLCHVIKSMMTISTVIRSDNYSEDQNNEEPHYSAITWKLICAFDLYPRFSPGAKDWIGKFVSFRALYPFGLKHNWLFVKVEGPPATSGLEENVQPKSSISTIKTNTDIDLQKVSHILQINDKIGVIKDRKYNNDRFSIFVFVYTNLIGITLDLFVHLTIKRKRMTNNDTSICSTTSSRCSSSNVKICFIFVEPGSKEDDATEAERSNLQMAMKPLPKLPKPIYCELLAKVTLTCSGIERSERENIFTLTEYMGGKFTRDLEVSCKVLISGDVTSTKYQISAERNIVIVNTDWFFDLWDRCRNEKCNLSSDLLCFDPLNSEYCAKYRLPPFHKLKIAVSGLLTDEREAAKELINNNGGTYSSQLVMHETTHLISDSTDSPKYKAAVQWKIFVVNKQWLHDSAQSGFCKNPSKYPIGGVVSSNQFKQPAPKISTPNENKVPRFSTLIDPNNTTATNLTISCENSRPNFEEISTLNFKNCVNETVMSEYVPKAKKTSTPRMSIKRPSLMDVDSPCAKVKADNPAETHVDDSIDQMDTGPAKFDPNDTFVPNFELEDSKLGEVSAYESPTVILERNLKTAVQTTNEAPMCLRDGSPMHVDNDDVFAHNDKKEIREDRIHLTKQLTNVLSRAKTADDPEATPSPIRSQSSTTSTSTVASCPPTGLTTVTMAATKSLSGSVIGESTTGESSKIVNGASKFLVGQCAGRSISDQSPSIYDENWFQNDATSTTATSATTANNIGNGETKTSTTSAMPYSQGDFRISWNESASETSTSSKKTFQKSNSNLKIKRPNPSAETQNLDDEEIVLCSEKPSTSNKSKKFFLLTSLDLKVKTVCLEVIRQLGGDYSDSSTYDVRCTHLIVGNFLIRNKFCEMAFVSAHSLGKPTRNEKFLTSVACGRWILHWSYLEACRKAGRFIDEEKFEWGGPTLNKLLHDLPDEMSRNMAKACKRWRLALQKDQFSRPAYNGWSVLLVVNAEMEPGLKNLLKFGGAKICDENTSLSKLTHLFIGDTKKPKNAELLKNMKKANVKCCKPEYLSSYLIDYPAHDSPFLL